MGRIIVASALGGWLAIVAIAIALNSREAQAACYRDAGCLSMFAARGDRLILGGLAVALAVIIASMIVFAVRRARQGSQPTYRYPRQASREARPRLR